MLSRENRLTSKEFSLYRKGETYKTHLFYIKIIKNNQNINKLGIIIAKKNLKGSSKRNSLKRKLCYYYNNSIIDKLKAENKSEVIIITYMGDKSLNNNKQNSNSHIDYKQIKEELDTAFKPFYATDNKVATQDTVKNK